MSDAKNAFEARLTTALRSAGDGAPEADGLASAARGRVRARRRRTALTAVAASVAVAAVFGGVAVLAGGDAPRVVLPAEQEPPTATDTSTPSASDTRLESWRDISVRVPAEWGYGNLSTYCIQEGRPVVDRPGGVVRAVGCGPYEQGYGVQLRDGSAINLVYPPGHIWQYGWESEDQVKLYPEDSWLGYQGSGDNLVWVVAEDRATVESILDSFTSFEVDGNGCPTREFAEDVSNAAEGEVRICRYSSDQWLEQSEVLTGQDAQDAVAAFDAAPAQQMHSCPIRNERTWINLMAGDQTGNVQLMGGCNGLGWDNGWHELTPEVMYWVLSPGWSGGFDGGVPMPTKLRQLGG
jgi:hypothetical protein